MARARQASGSSSASSASVATLFETLLEERLDDLLLVGEASIGGADADAGVRGDVVHRHVESAQCEDLARRGQQPFAVAFGVLAQRALSGVLLGHGYTVAVCGHGVSASC